MKRLRGAQINISRNRAEDKSGQVPVRNKVISVD